MPEMTGYPHGTFSWIELSTTDLGGAKAFYSALFGWEPEDMPAPGGGNYTMCKLNGHYVSAMQEMNEGMRGQGHPPVWLSYVTVDDVDATTAKAQELGGNVLQGPFDVGDSGRMSLIQDPSRAAFALWQAKDHPGAGLVDEPGTLCWNELTTNDVAGAREFYTSLFGWSAGTEDMGGFEYTTFRGGDSPKAGMAKIDPDMGDMPPSWSVSFTVVDCDGSAAAVKDLGGDIVVPPTDFPGGRFAIAKDPQGAYFGVVTLAPPAE